MRVVLVIGGCHRLRPCRLAGYVLGRYQRLFCVHSLRHRCCGRLRLVDGLPVGVLWAEFILMAISLGMLCPTSPPSHFLMVRVRSERGGLCHPLHADLA
jgi:hypothetical protein